METRTKEIETRKYQILQPAVRQSMPLCTRVAVLVGPVLTSLGKQVEQGGLQIFTQALQNVDPDKVDKLFMDAVLATHLCCNGESISDPVMFEKHFNAFRGDVYMVCCWVLWEVVKDFFPQAAAFSQIAKQAMAAAYKSQMDGQQTTG